MRHRRFLTFCAVVICASALSSGTAWAHAPSPGLKGAWAGALHVWKDAYQWPLLIVIGLTARHLPLARLQAVLGSFVGLAIFGLGLALTDTRPDQNTVLTGLLFITASSGLLIATLPDRLFALLLLLVGAGGLTSGLRQLPDPGTSSALIATILGSTAALGLTSVLLAGLIDYLRELPFKQISAIGVRVGAAWAAVIAALMLALLLVTPPAG